MKVFITGGTGFIGSHLAEFLLENHDVEVFALVRDMNNLKWLNDLNIHPLKGDLLNLPGLPRDLDYFFHIAGSIKAHKLADYYTVNQQGTASIFQSLQRQGIHPKRVVYLSSLAAAGPSPGCVPVAEDADPNPVSPYGESKLRGEEEALRFKDEFPLVIIRVGGVYGPKDRDFLKYFKMINRGILPSMGGGSRLLSLCYVSDLCRGITQAAQTDIKSGEVFNIAEAKSYSWNDIGRTAGKILGKKLLKLNIPLPLVFLTAVGADFLSLFTRKRSIINRHKYTEYCQDGWVADTTKAADLLDFHAEYSLEQGLCETLQWYQEHNWL